MKEFEAFLALMFDCETCGHAFHFGECPVRVWSSGDKDPCGCVNGRDRRRNRRR